MKNKTDRKKAIMEFEEMRDNAELKCIQNVSLQRPLSKLEFNRMRELAIKLYGDIF